MYKATEYPKFKNNFDGGLNEDRFVKWGEGNHYRTSYHDMHNTVIFINLLYRFQLRKKQ